MACFVRITASAPHSSQQGTRGASGCLQPGPPRWVRKSRLCPQGDGDSGRKQTHTGNEQPCLFTRGLLEGSRPPFSAHIFSLHRNSSLQTHGPEYITALLRNLLSGSESSHPLSAGDTSTLPGGCLRPQTVQSPVQIASVSTQPICSARYRARYCLRLLTFIFNVFPYTYLLMIKFNSLLGAVRDEQQ